MTAVALAPASFAATQADWQFNEVARTTNGLSFETLTAVVTAVRLALVGLFLATAALLLAGPPAVGALSAAAALIGLPFLFSLVGGASDYSPPWGVLMSGGATLLGYLGMAGLLLTLFIFPDGRFYPARLRVPALAGGLISLTAIVALQFVEEAWLVFIVALLLAILLGVAGQVWRYRSAGSAQRRRTVGFLVATLALPLWILTGVGGVSPLLNLIAGYAVLALLAGGLFLAARRGAWGEPAPVRPFAGAAAFLVIAAGFAAGLWWRGNQPATIDVSALKPAASIPILLDTDMAMDDISALLYLTRHPAVDLRAVTVNGVAFAHCAAGVRNALGLLELAGAADVPVSCGREEPYPGGRPAPDEWRASADALYGAQVMIRGRTAESRPASELLADTIRAAPGEIVVIALGPLTNLAEAFETDPALAGQIKELIIMGGAVNAPGNVTDGDSANQVAEWNFFADPLAADVVLTSGAPVKLVPLDATNDVPFSRGFYERLRATHLTKPAVFTYNLMYLNQWWLDGGMYWWDTLAAAAALDSGVVTWQEMKLDIVTEAGPETGRSIATTDGSSVRVATAADRQAFEALFLAVLNHE